MLVQLLPYLISLSISIALAVAAIRRRYAPGAVELGFIFFLFATATFLFIIEHLVPTLAEKSLFDNLAYLADIIMPVAFTRFTFKYTQTRVKNPLVVLSSILIPAFVSTIYLFTSIGGNVRSSARLISSAAYNLLVYDFTTADYVVWGYILAYVLVSIAFLLNFSRKQAIIFKQQTLIIAGGMFVPMLAMIANPLGIALNGERDITPFTFAACGLVLAWGFFRHAIFDITPVAQDVILDRISDALVVLDVKNRILQANPAFRQLFNVPLMDAAGKPLSTVTNALEEVINSPSDVEKGLEIVLQRNGRELDFELRIIPIYDHDFMAGRIIIFHDITERKLAADLLQQGKSALEERVTARTAELASANRKLIAEIEKCKQIEIEKDAEDRDLEALYQFSMELADLPAETDLDRLVGTKLKEMTGAYIAGVSEYDPDLRLLKTSYLVGDSKIFQEANRLLNVNFRKMTYPVDDATYQEITTGIIGYKSSLSEVAFGAISPAAANVVKMMFGLEVFIGLAFIHQGKLQGTAILAFQSGQPLPLEKSLMAFGRIAAIGYNRRRMDAARRLSESRFTELAEMLPQSIYECDLNGRVLFANKKAFELFQYSPEDITAGVNILAVFAEQERESAWQDTLLILSGAEQARHEYILKRKDESIFPALIYSNAIMREDQVVGLRGVVVDISERKQAEEVLKAKEAKFRKVVEQLFEGLVLLDESGEVSDVNPAFEQIFASNRADFVGKPFWEIQMLSQPPELRTAERLESLKLRFSEMLNTQSSPFFHIPLETKFKNASGDEKIIEQTIFPVHTEDGLRIAAVIRDITRQKMDQLALERYARRMKVLHQIDQSILAAQTTREIAAAALEGIGQMLSFKVSAVTMANLHAGQIETLAILGHEREQSCLFLSDDRMISTLPKQQPVYIADTRQSSLSCQACRLCDNAGGHTILYVPLKYQGLLVGWLHLCAAVTDAYHAEEMEIAQEIANQLAIALQQARLNEQTKKALEREENLNQLARSVSSTLDLNKLIPVFIQLAYKLVGGDGAALSLLSPDGKSLLLPDEYAFPPGLGGFVTDETRGISWQVAQSKLAVKLDSYAASPSAVPAWVDAGVKALIAVPLMVGGDLLGVFGVFRLNSSDPFAQRDLDLTEAIGRQAALAVHNAQSFEKMQLSTENLAMAYDATIEGWSKALELRDKETRGHSERVGQLSMRLAGMAGMAEKEFIHFRRGVLLHDIGKMGIPDSILLKPGPLNSAEWEIMRQHPTYARDLLANISYLQDALNVPYCHHERWDGSGYPNKLKGEEIPLGARIFAVVDVWDALISDRPYRSGWTRQAAAAYIKQKAGSEFDPRIVDLFLHILQDEDLV